MLHIIRRLATAAAILLVLAGPGGTAAPASLTQTPSAGAPLAYSEWLAYATRFVAPDGRVVDTGNGGISHSEGQGYAMVLATAYNDRDRFERIWRWAQRELQVRDDRLFAWRWQPDGAATADQAVPGRVTDRNAASDGDILIAWALLRAAALWDEPAYAAAARPILDDIRATMIVSTAFGQTLLPGPFGFVHDDRIVVNLSYWVFPALATFAEIDDDPVWRELIDTGTALLRAARFGEHDLPPDWLQLADAPAPAEGFNPNFGYDAIRVPLYAFWGGAGDGVLAPFRAFWRRFDGQPFIPATLDLTTGGLAEYGMSAGGRAIVVLTRFGATAPDHVPFMLPRIGPDDDYYSATLILLSKVAFAERL